ncbi:hypothetical protein CLV56_3176 [Mumia flava]|uniref:DUF420 domain-containing protein n=1 Tax=Mumia flava TaxID=1348852 RepID=A0A0B2BQ95_9ACTN|nr:hypothetical protein [Mumia flava]PJJ53685.1 hypothetical protein CLV56_3176 [Mumia flava]
MTYETAAWILLMLGLVVVLLTRLRLGRSESGAQTVGPGILNLHTVNGLAAFAVSLVYQLAGHDRPVGALAVGLWIVEAVLGLMILLRWLPVHGRHATRLGSDGWTDGPWLSIVAHVGMAIGVGLLAWWFVAGLV